MTDTVPVSDTVTALGTALIVSSRAPLLLLADDLTVIGASGSFLQRVRDRSRNRKRDEACGPG